MILTRGMRHRQRDRVGYEFTWLEELLRLRVFEIAEMVDPTQSLTTIAVVKIVRRGASRARRQRYEAVDAVSRGAGSSVAMMNSVTSDARNSRRRDGRARPNCGHVIDLAGNLVAPANHRPVTAVTFIGRELELTQALKTISAFRLRPSSGAAIAAPTPDSEPISQFQQPSPAMIDENVNIDSDSPDHHPTVC